MKKAISRFFSGALSIAVLVWAIAVLAWAFDAMARVGNAGNAGHAGDAVLAEIEPSGEFTDILDHDHIDSNVARSGLSRRALANIELTDEQWEQIDTLRSAFTREMVQLRADTRLARIELRELLSETSPDVNKVRELAAAVSRAQGSVFERGAVFRAEFKNVLTPEQQEKVRESFRDRRDGRRGSDMRWRRGGRESRNRR